MTLDLREELENATSALAPGATWSAEHSAGPSSPRDAPTPKNPRRRTRSRRCLAVGIANFPAQWSQQVGDVQPGGQATSAPTSIEAALAAVSLPDPAPGFPYRLIADGAPSQATVDGQQYWIRNFDLAVKPETTTTDSSGTVTGEANGPEAVVQVGTFPLPGDGGVVDRHPIVERPDVAGTTGVVVRYNARDGSPVAALYFHAGAFTASVMGFGGVTTDQLTALGNALTGMN